MVSDNACKLRYNELSHCLKADFYSFNDSTGSGFLSVSIDSRNISEGAMFVALNGTKCDGHSFVEMAFQKGASAALVERAKIESFNLIQTAKKWGKSIIAVDDTLESFQNAAKMYLNKFPGLLKIAITGSSGKTTTKEIAANIIVNEKSVVINPGNYNSEIGLPLAIFNIRPCHEVGIFELGINHRGEMAVLASILKPDIALITNVGTAHIGNIGSIDEIAYEKKIVFSNFSGKGIAVIPQESPFRNFLLQGVEGKVLFHGKQAFTELGECKDMGLCGWDIIWDGQHVNFPLPGNYNLLNALAAIAIAKEIPVSSNSIRQGLKSVRALPGRSEIINGDVTVIWDNYNSNPEALQQALQFCENLQWKGRKVYVIGEMLELGEKAQQAHWDIGQFLTESKADMVFLFGQETAAVMQAIAAAQPHAYLKAAQVFHTCSIQALTQALNSYICSGDLVLIKGSRDCNLENLSNIFAEKLYKGAA